MNNRIVQLRKSREWTQDKFAEEMGISKNYVSLIENGKKKPSDRLISDICQEFNVNEEWLRTGNGEMLNERDGSFTELLSDLDDSDDDFIKSLIKVYMGLDKASKDALRKIAEGMAEEYKRRG